MNDKIKAILIQVGNALRKKEGWNVGNDCDIMLLHENKLPITKTIRVRGALGEKELSDSVYVEMRLGMDSDDKVTFYPNFLFSTTMTFPEIGVYKQIELTSDSQQGFTDRDTHNVVAFETVAREIDVAVSINLNDEYQELIDDNAGRLDREEGGSTEPPKPDR